jgi:hypothetical protein
VRYIRIYFEWFYVFSSSVVAIVRHHDRIADHVKAMCANPKDTVPLRYANAANGKAREYFV